MTTTRTDASSEAQGIGGYYRSRSAVSRHDKVAQPGRRGEPDRHKPSWKEECRSLGITPEQVRQWKRPNQAETDIRHLLGEDTNKNPGKHVECRNALAVKHLERLCTLVLSDREGDAERAEQLAAALAERYRF